MEKHSWKLNFIVSFYFFLRVHFDRLNATLRALRGEFLFLQTVPIFKATSIIFNGNLIFKHYFAFPYEYMQNRRV